MNCGAVRERFSEHLDGQLAAREARQVEEHLQACAGCARHWSELRTALELLSELPQEPAPEVIAARVLGRVEAETRGPGLRALYRSSWSARPLFLPSLVPAAVLLGLTLSLALRLDAPMVADEPLPPVPAQMLGDWNTAPARPAPRVHTPKVGLPRALQGSVREQDLLDNLVEGSLFLETVVGSDGNVSDITVLDGNQELATPLREALWRERYEPVRYRGRPASVNVYRLISRMEVRAPLT